MKTLLLLMLPLTMFFGAKSQPYTKETKLQKNTQNLSMKDPYIFKNKEIPKTPISLFVDSIEIFNNQTTNKNEITIGTGTYSGYYPIWPIWAYNYSQNIYLANEINTSGAITKIKYFFTGETLNNSNQWTVYMGHTAKNSFTNGNDYINVSKLTEVYSNTIAWATNSWIELELQTPFPYNGTDNLVIAVNETKPGFSSTPTAFNCTQVTTYRGLLWVTDGNPWNPANPGEAPYCEAVIPNIKITFSNTHVVFNVTNSLNNPVDNATVTIGTTTKYTNAQGQVDIYIEPGSYNYSISKIGYESQTGTITITEGENLNIDIVLVSIDGSDLAFNITNTNNEPLNANVSIFVNNSPVLSGNATNGSIVFQNLPNDIYDYTVTHNGYITQENSVTILDSDQTIDIVMEQDPNIAIGNGILTGELYPIFAYYSYSYSQSIYLNSELGPEHRYITHLKYSFAGENLSNSNDWTIYIGHTKKTKFTGTSDWIPVTQLTQVYSNTFDNPSGAGWIVLELETPFLYNGKDNLAIAIDENSPGYNGFMDRFYCSTVENNRSMMVFSDDKNPDPIKPPSANGLGAVVPNIILATQYAPGANITFTVKDSETTAPIADAIVSIKSELLRTSANGTVSSYILEDNNIPFTVTKYGYVTYHGEITVVDRVDQTINVNLVPSPCFSMEILVKNTLNQPIPDAGINVCYNDDVVVSGISNNQGQFFINSIPNETYMVNVKAIGFEPKSQIVQVNNSNTQAVIELVEIIWSPYMLEAEQTSDDGDVFFSWNNYNGFYDDFESYDDFIYQNIGDYTQYDGDGSETYGFIAINFPNQEYTGSYIVFNPNQTTPPISNEDMDPLSGEKILACFAAKNPPNNDWLITPQIPVVPETKFAFWAKTYMDYGLEEFQVAVSTTDVNPSSFTLIDTKPVEVPLNWTYYEYDLTQYSGQYIYMAIICKSNDAFILMIDDLEVRQDAKNTKLTVKYDVSLDGVNVASDIETNHFVFNKLQPGNHTFGVKCKFQTQESSETLLNFTVTTVGTNESYFKTTIYPNPTSDFLNISANGQYNVRITDMFGRVLIDKNIYNSANIDIRRLPEGVYVLTANNKKEQTTNLIIKK